MNVWLLGRGELRRRHDDVLQLERAFLTDRTGLHFVNARSSEDLLALAESRRAEQQWPVLDAEWISPVGTDTCDDLVWQNLESTLDGRPDTFYSTAGFEAGNTLSGTGELAPGEAFLAYRFWRPVRVYAVQLRAFQADFHPGRPVYPFQVARVGVGCSLQAGMSLSYGADASAPGTSCNYRCFCTTEQQTLVFDDPMVGVYLVICLKGFPQQQLTDRLHYAAVSGIRVFGEPISSPALENELSCLISRGFILDGRDAARWLDLRSAQEHAAPMHIPEDEVI
ncbi:hypothetical protein CYME_CMJ295C [Cyanidioschyzon merolae strain 10D]|jgi:hypothetical protein|uniref:Uncharacterized protein n=1 Tax=Cyanidioschyzon merolae (strain NIES-3377 / 10D) TaxID=280699 RepID=M1V880_CYAM1|nr:hypothetical protein CYME_CMJ295C [Cyanidioschyzon merolae strain 10D]BAM80389.1 hypothetical protein CYME_CMJ295C [Cyanidioschyzon merolae strain 10D]|eukprot:XP_005534996.1 hypothetical protein CYME_CMJ295C [Cyanidioschyzon merolae strain 10D]